MNINECASNPCQNNGVCISGFESYTCKCQSGYSGVNCQFNIDDCAAAPCKNGGTCVDGLRSYTCQCPAGYTGANCEHAIDRCVGQPCKNGGICVNTLTGYKCLCKPTYYGCRCSQGKCQCIITYLLSSCKQVNLKLGKRWEIAEEKVQRPQCYSRNGSRRQLLLTIVLIALILKVIHSDGSDRIGNNFSTYVLFFFVNSFDTSSQSTVAEIVLFSQFSFWGYFLSIFSSDYESDSIVMSRETTFLRSCSKFLPTS